MNLFIYVIHFSGSFRFTHTASPEKISGKYIGNLGARKMKLGSLDGKDDGKYNSINFVEISEISVMQDIYFS